MSYKTTSSSATIRTSCVTFSRAPSSFRSHDPKNLQIVALENNVLAVNKKNLKRPTRASLATPTRNLQSKSGIVNSPY